MKYKHIKTGNIINTPFEITSKTWLPVEKKKPPKDDKPPKEAPKEGKD